MRLARTIPRTYRRCPALLRRDNGACIWQGRNQAIVGWESTMRALRYLGAIAMACCLVSLQAAQASQLSDCGLGQNDCRGLIGKRLWIVVPKANPNNVEVSPVANEWSNTKKLKTGSFLITGIVPNKTYGHLFVVKMPNGVTGYVSNGSWIFLSESDPAQDARKLVAAQKARQEECERRGQPKIGMSSEELIASCWGKPARIVKKTTADGVEETYVYGVGHAVRLSNGKIAEIVEAR